MVQAQARDTISSFSIEKAIADIIDKRKPLANRINSVSENLNSISKILGSVQLQRNTLLSKVQDKNTINKLNQIDFNPLSRQIENELVALDKLKSRFSRQTLNIGVIGRARQGKSRLLQSLTGLSSLEIPDGDGQHCTGVRSNIHHVSGIATYAEVSFHSEDSFLKEVIVPYYQQLDLGSIPQSLNDFTKSSLAEIKSASALDKAKYEHLKKYHKNVDRYQHFLQERNKIRIDKEQIREYVAQDTIEGKREYCAYLAVKQVDIFCSFPNQDIGKISLVDMPGLGDTGIGDADRMIQTLGKDIDVVLFVRMPKSMGDYWATEDVDLYDLANSALSDLPIQEWSFMVLNRVPKIENHKRCQELKEDIKEKHISVKDVIIADCADPEETQTAILDRVLDYLAQRIDVLDAKYASACQQRLLNIQKSFAEQLELAQEISGQNRNSDWNRQSTRLFSSLWNDIRENLESLIKDTISQRDTQDRNLASAVGRVIKDCEQNPNIPTVEEILQERNREGSFDGAYSECQHQVRTDLSQRFLNFDVALNESLEAAKSRVVKVLIENGRLGNIAEGEDSQFLHNLLAKIPEDLTELRQGFDTLATFELQYRGLIQHRIRKHLDVLTPDRTPYKREDFLDALFRNKYSDLQQAQRIRHNLSNAQKEAVYHCYIELEEILIEPNQAGFAIVEEFCDRILRSKGIRDEWEIFIKEYAAQVWQEEYAASNANYELKKEWIDLMTTLKPKSDLRHFKLENL